MTVRLVGYRRLFVVFYSVINIVVLYRHGHCALHARIAHSFRSRIFAHRIKSACALRRSSIKTSAHNAHQRIVAHQTSRYGFINILVTRIA